MTAGDWRRSLAAINSLALHQSDVAAFMPALGDLTNKAYAASDRTLLSLAVLRGLPAWRLPSPFSSDMVSNLGNLSRVDKVPEGTDGLHGFGVTARHWRYLGLIFRRT